MLLVAGLEMMSKDGEGCCDGDLMWSEFSGCVWKAEISRYLYAAKASYLLIFQESSLVSNAPGRTPMPIQPQNRCLYCLPRPFSLRHR